MNKRLYRSRKDRVLGGVAAGLGQYLDTDPVLWRLIFVIGTFLTGGGLFLAYIVAWIIVPEEPVGVSRVDSRPRDSAEDVGDRLRKSAEEIADAGARIARDVVDGIRGSRHSQSESSGGSGSLEHSATTDSGARAVSTEPAKEDETGGGSSAATILGVLLVGVGGIALFNRLFYRVFRADITLPVILIVLGAVVILSGRRK